MCEHCTPLTKLRFPSKRDFISFKKKFKAKLVDGTFIQVINSDETEHTSLESTYQCTFCSIDWVLSLPKNVWRGYFLPEESIVKYEDNEPSSNFKTFQGKSCGGCLLMILLLLALIIYGLYSLVAFLFDLLF